MKNKSTIKIFSLIFSFIFLISNCREARETTKPEPPPTPAEKITPVITFKIATLNLENKSTRYTKKSISELAQIISNENIDIVSVIGITRYPDLPNRIDSIDELHKVSEMNYKFIEIQNYSGRQFGNAVFSLYPIKEKEKYEFHSLKNLTSMEIKIDIGITDLHLTSIYFHNSINDKEK